MQELEDMGFPLAWEAFRDALAEVAAKRLPLVSGEPYNAAVSGVLLASDLEELKERFPWEWFALAMDAEPT